MNRLKLMLMHFVLACSAFFGASGKDLGPVIDEIEVRSSWKELTDTATVTMPKALVDYELIDIQVGDAVTLECGYLIPQYDAEADEIKNSRYMREIFTGYVSRVNPKVPLEVQCEDASCLLKQVNINKSWTSKVTLKEIVTYVTDQVNAFHTDKTDITFSTQEIPSITFDKFRIPNKNAAQVLQTFKESPYNLAIYFRNHELKIHMAYSSPSGEVSYFLSPGTAGDQNVVSHELEYRSASDHKVQIKAVLLKGNNTFSEQVYGDAGGDTYTLTFNKDESPDLVKQLVESKLKRYAEGYRGRLTTLMIPYATHSMTARVVDPEFGRDDKYHIDATTLRFGDGITINAELGVKLS